MRGRETHKHLCIHLFILYILTVTRAGFGVIWVSTWMIGIQSLELSLLPPSVCISRMLKFGTKAGYATQVLPIYHTDTLHTKLNACPENCHFKKLSPVLTLLSVACARHIFRQSALQQFMFRSFSYFMLWVQFRTLSCEPQVSEAHRSSQRVLYIASLNIKVS